MTDISLFETIRTQRSIRRFTTEPVSDEAIETILEAAIRAPSPGNRQPWYFLVIRDRETKQHLGDWYLDSWKATIGMDDPDIEKLPQAYRLGGELGQKMADIPVVILACVEMGAGWAGPHDITDGASIYPAVQNLLLAARSLGLGTVLTTMHRRYEAEIKEFLGIPEKVITTALIPLGYPGEGQRFGGSKRKPLNEVAFYDRWGRGKTG